ncbi:MAG: NTP transferase domain-containing protein [Pirellulaceae bacterium]|nr:NTP transferase domain-containing protein [Pirellulaceae bacterium]
MAATAIILAAGKGTRMKSELPKVLCQANGRPLVGYVIDALQAAGVDQLICVVGYRAELVQESLGRIPNIAFAVQAEQLGTGHAVMMCREHLQNRTGPVVVVAGDSPMLQTASVLKILDAYHEHKAGCVLGTLQHPNPSGLGRIVRDTNGEFVRIVEEKDASESEKAINEVNMSTYVFDAQALLRGLEQLTNNNQQREYYITDLPEILRSQGLPVMALPVLQPIEALSVNTVEQLAEVEAALQQLKGESCGN